MKPVNLGSNVKEIARRDNMKVHCYQCGEEYNQEDGFGDYNEFCSGECENRFSSNRLYGEF